MKELDKYKNDLPDWIVYWDYLKSSNISQSKAFDSFLSYAEFHKNESWAKTFLDFHNNYTRSAAIGKFNKFMTDLTINWIDVLNKAYKTIDRIENIIKALYYPGIDGSHRPAVIYDSECNTIDLQFCVAIDKGVRKTYFDELMKENFTEVYWSSTSRPKLGIKHWYTLHVIP